MVTEQRGNRNSLSLSLSMRIDAIGEGTHNSQIDSVLGQGDRRQHLGGVMFALACGLINFRTFLRVASTTKVSATLPQQVAANIMCVMLLGCSVAVLYLLTVVFHYCEMATRL